MTENQDKQAELPLGTAGDRLRAGREAAGLGTADIAARTRIPERHILALEAGDYGALAARAYAVGFSRIYARAVGLDEGEIVEAVRADLGASSAAEDRPHSQAYEPGDPSRVADRRLAWVAALAAFGVIVAGYFLWRQYQVPAMDLPALATEEVAAPAVAASPAVPAPAQGPVVFTALADGIWVKFYDAQGVQLMQKQLASGETYTVPADAAGPRLWTARPDALAITIGGQPVPPISDRQVTVQDVPVSAAALLARVAPGAAPASATAAPAVPVRSPSRPTRSRPAEPRPAPQAAPPAPVQDAATAAPAEPAPESTVSG